MTLPVGARVGPYEIVSALGAGGMGEVYRARDPRLGRDVAIKILPQAFTADRDRLTRFEREARALASLNHPNIATIHQVEDSDGTPALVMELLEGPTLAERVAQGPLALSEALTIARQIADALATAHEKGIIHRDLKPANVKLSSTGAVKVLDFGLAKTTTDCADANRPDAPTVAVDRTSEGIVLGTAAYMSPEQARGQSVDKEVSFVAGTPRVLFAARFADLGGSYWSNYDVTRDGQSFLMLAADQTSAPRLNVILNWGTTLKTP